MFDRIALIVLWLGYIGIATIGAFSVFSFMQFLALRFARLVATEVVRLVNVKEKAE